MERSVMRKERYHIYNSLLCLAKALEKRYTTIDLRNDTCVTGKIGEVDGFMNIFLNDATFYDSDGKHHYFPMLFLQARNIRNIHIPDNIRIRKTIEEAVTIIPKKREKKPKTFKQFRAQKNQQETLKFINEMKLREKPNKASL